MKRIRVLLIDTEETVKLQLQRKQSKKESVAFDVRLLNAKESQDLIELPDPMPDAIIFRDTVSQSIILRWTRMFRSRGASMPILLLTKVSEAKVSAKLQQAGIDDVLNTAEIGTPLFLWTFVSTLRHAQVKKKASEFDTLRKRLHRISDSLAFISHELNNPLSVIRLALYHLEKPDLAPEKRDIFFKLLADNVDKVDRQVKELRSIRRQLGDGVPPGANIFSLHELRTRAASSRS
jgi:signal transduction histidine kinase